MANPDVKYSSVTNEGNPFVREHTQDIPDDAELGVESDNDDVPHNNNMLQFVDKNNGMSMSNLW